MASESPQKNSGTNIWPWALAVGLLAGFLVGREMGPRSGTASDEGSREKPSAAGAAAPSAAVPGKVYKSEADFPAGYLKASDLAGVAGVSFDGMNDGQKALAMQALNERNCECGCGMGGIAGCAKKDPNCPKSPKLTKD